MNQISTIPRDNPCAGDAFALVESEHVEVWLHGDIDASMGAELALLITDLDHLRLPVILDASNVSFCDSAGIAFVIRLMGCGLPVTLRRPSPALRLLLDALVL